MHFAQPGHTSALISESDFLPSCSSRTSKFSGQAARHFRAHVVERRRGDATATSAAHPFVYDDGMNYHRLMILVCSALHHLGTWAHEGHGLQGAHWHATDALGFVAAVGVGLIAWYFGHRK